MKMWREKLAVLLTTSWIGLTVLGCVPAGSDVWCLTNKPRVPTDVEYAVMDRAGKEDMRVHNLYGQRRCGWKVPE